MKLLVEVNNLELFNYIKELDNVYGMILSLEELSLNDSPMSISDFETLLNTKTKLKKVLNAERIFLENEIDVAYELIKKYSKDIDYIMEKYPERIK